VGNRYYSLNVRISRFSYFPFHVRRILLDQVLASPQNENLYRIVDATLDLSFGRFRGRSRISAASDSRFLGFLFPELRYAHRIATRKFYVDALIHRRRDSFMLAQKFRCYTGGYSASIASYMHFTYEIENDEACRIFPTHA
jgi:hypothetical protein